MFAWYNVNKRKIVTITMIRIHWVATEIGNKDGFASNDNKLEMCFCHHIIFNIPKNPGS